MARGTAGYIGDRGSLLGQGVWTMQEVYERALTNIWPPLPPLNIQYLVVAGGGGGGTSSTVRNGGGGGGGGYRTGTDISLARSTSYTVTIGGGGAADAPGSNSVFSTITSNGGGYGGDVTGSP
jgi:hypothetical protein